MTELTIGEQIIAQRDIQMAQPRKSYWWLAGVLIMASSFLVKSHGFQAVAFVIIAGLGLAIWDLRKDFKNKIKSGVTSKMSGQ